MFLNNPFPLRVKVLFMDCHACFLCGVNYPLEIHHIFGRSSSCAFNAIVLCKECHSHIGHTQEEHKRLTIKTIVFLLDQNYKPNDEDWEHLRSNPFILLSEELQRACG